MTDPRPAPPIDFVTFILSLASGAFVHMGDAPNPETHVFEPNLPLAKETIDLLGLLREKTRGNLTPEEEKFFENLLMDLRLRYVQRTGGAPPPAGPAVP